MSKEEFIKKALELMNEGEDTIETEEGLLILSFQYKEQNEKQ